MCMNTSPKAAAARAIFGSRSLLFIVSNAFLIFNPVFFSFLQVRMMYKGRRILADFLSADTKSLHLSASAVLGEFRQVFGNIAQ